MVYRPSRTHVDVSLPDDQEKREKLLEKFNEWKPSPDFNPPVSGNFNTDEIYVDDYDNQTVIRVSGAIEGLYIGMEIPLYAGDDLKSFARNLAEEAGISTFQGNSGIFLEKGEIAEIRDKTADGQGRINLGKSYAGEDVEVVVIKK